MRALNILGFNHAHFLEIIYPSIVVVDHSVNLLCISLCKESVKCFLRETKPKTKMIEIEKGMMGILILEHHDIRIFFSQLSNFLTFESKRK